MDAAPSNCFTDASGTGDAGGRSVQAIGGGDFSFTFNFGTTPSEGRCFGGLTINGFYHNDFTEMKYCWHVSDQINTPQSLDPHTLVIYEFGFSQAIFEGVYTPGDELEIRCDSGVVTYWHNGVLKGTSSLPPSYPLWAAASIACHNKTVNDAHLCTGATGNPSEPGGGSETTADAADSFGVMIDRLVTSAQITAGALGINFGAGPVNRIDAWGAGELWVDRGAGYLKIGEVEEGIVGKATTVLAGTTIGTETVQVEIQPSQSLPTNGTVWLGGEIFDYGAATQDDDSPNRWTLSTLANRGSLCTEAAKSTHATNEKFLLLSDTYAFISMPATEIGLTRNYKIVTAGQDLADVSPTSFTFDAPNFIPVTPADYAVTADVDRGEVVHTWTPISDACLVGFGLVYEIYLDDGAGNPGTLLWTGVSNQWREVTTGVRTYHFRVKTSYAAGDYEVRDVDSSAPTINILEYQVMDYADDVLELDIFS